MRQCIPLILVVLASCGPSPDEIKMQEDAKRRAIEAQKASIAHAKETREILSLKKVLTRDFLDPESVKYQNLRYTGVTLCGELNAKNSFGAYTGYTRFVVQEQVTLIEREMLKTQQRLAANGMTEIAKSHLDGFEGLQELCKTQGHPAS